MFRTSRFTSGKRTGSGRLWPKFRGLSSSWAAIRLRKRPRTWETEFGIIGGFMGCPRRSWSDSWVSIRRRWLDGREENISPQNDFWQSCFHFGLLMARVLQSLKDTVGYGFQFCFLLFPILVGVDTLTLASPMTYHVPKQWSG